MEMMIAILFFSVTSAVCIQIFVKAHLIQEDTIALNHGVALVESAAEIFRDTGTDKTKLYSYYPEAQWENDTMTIGYDEEWQACAPKNAASLLTMILMEDGSGKMKEADISLTQNDKVIYRQSVRRYLP